MANRYHPLYLKISDKGKPLSDSLKQAFADEIHINDYLGNISYTVIAAAIILCGSVAFHSGEFVLSYLFPTDGHWHARDPAGSLYVETWCTIFINACQVGFGFWGAVLFAIGFKRVLTAHKYFFGCFSLGLTFCGFAWYLPMMSQPIFQMLVDRMPYLMS
jgi:hypothetical protein